VQIFLHEVGCVGKKYIFTWKISGRGVRVRPETALEWTTKTFGIFFTSSNDIEYIIDNCPSRGHVKTCIGMGLRAISMWGALNSCQAKPIAWCPISQNIFYFLAQSRRENRNLTLTLFWLDNFWADSIKILWLLTHILQKKGSLSLSLSAQRFFSLPSIHPSDTKHVMTGHHIYY